MADIRGVAQPGRVLALGARCRRFEPSRPDHTFGFLFYIFMSPISIDFLSIAVSLAMLGTLEIIKKEPTKPNGEKRKRVKSLANDAVKQSDFSILDYMMGIEDMSERDRVWYELYKHYGNRNHTWQDFRDMFNDDLVTACKTAMHWKTWDQINAMRHQSNILGEDVRRSLKKYNMYAISEIDYRNLRNKHPDLVAKYEKFLFLHYNATPNYCTFNPEVAKIKRKYKNKIYLRRASAQYIRKMDKFIDLRNAEFVIGERIENYNRIISTDPYIFANITNQNLSRRKKIKLIHKILDESTRFHGSIKASVVLDKKLTSGGTYAIGQNTITFNQSLTESHSVCNMLDLVVHEDTHKIDYNNSDFGLLGSQIMDFQPNLYTHTGKKEPRLYYRDPVEQTAYFIGDIVGTALQKIINQAQR